MMQTDERTNETKLFSPHTAPALERCLFFKNQGSEGSKRKALTEEGDSFHKDCAALFRGQKTLHDFPKSKRGKMKWAIEVQRKYLSGPRWIEETVDIYDEHEQWVTNGTADLAGLDTTEEVLTAIDWKPGDYIDRWGQMYCYGLGLMDRYDRRDFKGVLAYYKSRHVDWRRITYHEAEERVYKLIARLRGEAGPEFHSINEWCGMCSVRLSEAGCPAWEEHRALLAQTGWPVELDQRIASIKNDPEKVARFIIADRRWRALVDAHELEEIIRPELEKEATGKKYGLKLQSRGYSIVIDPDANQQKQLE